MITLKYWNSLSPQCRKAIGEKYCNTSTYNSTLQNEFHHNLDGYIGRLIKEILSHCYLKDGKIEIRCLVLPTFAPKDNTIKNVQKKQKVSNYPVMHKYYFRLYTEDDREDGENVWTTAYNEDEARNNIYHDYHSISSLDLIKVV